MEKYIYSKKSIIVFFVIVIILSVIVETIYCVSNNGYLIIALMWIPALACLVANIVNYVQLKEKFNLKIFLNRCGFKLTSPLYILMGIIIPFIYMLIPYRIYWSMYPNNYAYTGVPFTTVLSDCFVYTIVCVLSGLLTATGEEIGWRGFMVPALNERLGTKKALIISSIFWCLWHYPLLIWGGYMEGTPIVYSIVAFTLCIFPVGIILGLLRLDSKSMWPCAFLHAAHNAFDQSVFSLLTRGDNRMFFVSETGIFTIVCAWVIAVIMYTRFKKEIVK